MLADKRSVRAAARLGLLKLIARLAPCPNREPHLGNGESLLVIRPDHLGDLLFATPALRRLRRYFPEVHITALVGSWAQPIVARGSLVDEAQYCDFPWFDGRPRGNLWQPYAHLFNLAAHLRKRSFTAVLNLRRDFWWGAALGHLARIPVRLGYDWQECRPFLNEIVTYRPGRHEVEQNLSLVQALASLCSIPSIDEQPELAFAVMPDERESAASYLGCKGATAGRPVVVIHAGSRAPVKLWSAERFAAVGTSLCGQLGATLLLTGNGAERGVAQRIAAMVDVPAIVAAGETTVGQLAALFERATLVIGVDSGPLHLAAAVGRPTVRLYGPSDPIAYGPYPADANHVVVRTDWDCSPCGRLDWSAAALKDHACMAAITVEQVLRAAQQALGKACLV